jgi:hypothetical protein
MSTKRRDNGWFTRLAQAGLLLGMLTATSASWAANRGTEAGQWQYLGGDTQHTRYSPADQINAENFADLEEAWVWDGASFSARSGRSTPSYINGILYTVAGPRRHVVAIDPKNAETLWTYREPDTPRYQYSMRKDYGKGVTYAEVDGRGIIYISSPAFFLTALDAVTGLPLEGFGSQVPIKGFPPTGVVDLLADLGHEYDHYEGIKLETGRSSSMALLLSVILTNRAITSHVRKIYRVISSVMTPEPVSFFGSSTCCRDRANSAMRLGKMMPGNGPVIFHPGRHWQQTRRAVLFMSPPMARRWIFTGAFDPVITCLVPA